MCVPVPSKDMDFQRHMSWYFFFIFVYDLKWGVIVCFVDTGEIVDHHFFFDLGFMVFNATFNNISVISWLSVLLVEETGLPGENHWSVASHWQILSHNVASSTPCLSGIRTFNKLYFRNSIIHTYSYLYLYSLPLYYIYNSLIPLLKDPLPLCEAVVLCNYYFGIQCRHPGVL